MAQNTTDEIPRSFSDKGLADAAAAGQDAPTQQDVNREEPDVRLQFRGRPTNARARARAKDTGRAELQAFAAALDAAMKRIGITPSELARRVWMTTVDRRGYTVPRNRDRISSYLAAQSFPEPENLKKLADALGIPAEELASTRPPEPERPEQQPRQNPPRRAASESSNPGTLVLTRLPARPGRTRLQVDCELNWKLATNIQNMIRQAEELEQGVLAEVPTPEINPDVGKVVGGTDTDKNGTK